MTLLEILSMICFSIGSSLLVCGIATIFRMGYKYIMYELYDRSTYENGPYIRGILLNIIIVLMTLSLLFFTIGALTYKTNEHNKNNREKINYCKEK